MKDGYYALLECILCGTSPEVALHDYCGMALHTGLKERTIEMIKKHPDWSTTRIAGDVGCTVDYVSRLVRKLRKEGTIA